MPRIAALAGSGRAGRTNSEAILAYLADRIPGHLRREDIGVALRLTRDDVAFRHFRDRLETADMLIVCAPVYFDTLPAPLTDILNRLVAGGACPGAGKTMAGIVHSGYPEPAQRKVTRDVLACWAAEAGFTWTGALSFGGTSPIEGRPLEDAGVFAGHVRQTIDTLVTTFPLDPTIPEEVVRSGDGAPVNLPPILTVALLNMVMRRRAREKGVRDLTARPLDA